MLLTRGRAPRRGSSHDSLRRPVARFDARKPEVHYRTGTVDVSQVFTFYGFVRDNVGRDTCSWRAATDGRSGGCAHETYTRRRFEQRCGRSTANAARASTHLGVRTNPPHNARGTAVVVSAGSAGRRRVGAAAELLSAQDASQGARAATSTWRRRQGQWQQGRQECAHVALPSAR